MALNFISEVTVDYSGESTKNTYSFLYNCKDKSIGLGWIQIGYKVGQFLNYYKNGSAIGGKNQPTRTTDDYTHSFANGVSAYACNTKTGQSFMFYWVGGGPYMYRFNNMVGWVDTFTLNGATQWGGGFAHDNLNKRFGHCRGFMDMIYFTNWDYDNNYGCNNHTRRPATDFSEGSFVQCSAITWLPGDFILLGSDIYNQRYVYKLNGTSLTPISNASTYRTIYNKMMYHVYTKIIDSTHILIRTSTDLELYYIDPITAVPTLISSASLSGFTLSGYDLQYQNEDGILAYNVSGNTLTIKVFYIKNNTIMVTGTDTLIDATYVPSIDRVHYFDDGTVMCYMEDYNSYGGSYPNRIRMYSSDFVNAINPPSQSALFLSTII